MITKIHTVVNCGIEPIAITIETETKSGIGIYIVGLPDTAVKESLMRAAVAVRSYGINIPGKKIIINMMPAVRLNTTNCDLAVAISLIAASEGSPLPDMDKWLVIGQLGLDGSVRNINGTVQAILTAKQQSLKGVIIPEANASEAALLASDIPVYPVKTLDEALAVIRQTPAAPDLSEYILDYSQREDSEYAFLRLTESERRAVVIAAAGGHPLLIEDRSTEKAYDIAQALRGLLPDMDGAQIQENLAIYSITDAEDYGMERPLRIPSYAASLACMFGGGAECRPGETALANNGVLLLDELELWPKPVIISLCGCYKEKVVTLSRLKGKIKYPANFLPVFAAKVNDGNQDKWLEKIVPDVFDIATVQVIAKDTDEKPGTDTMLFEKAKDTVARARQMQIGRQKDKTNDMLTAAETTIYIKLSDEELNLLDEMVYRLGLNARAYTRILRIARTIADLEDEEKIATRHLIEAAAYRYLDSRQNT